MKSSGQKTASAQIVTGHGYLGGIIVGGAAAAAGTIDLHDGTDTTGDRLINTINLIATADNDRMKPILFPKPIEFFDGCYLAITASAGTPQAVVYTEAG